MGQVNEKRAILPAEYVTVISRLSELSKIAFDLYQKQEAEKLASLGGALAQQIAIYSPIDNGQQNDIGEVEPLPETEVTSIRILESGYEINGQEFPANSEYASKNRDLLSILMANKGRRLTVEDIVADNSFLPGRSSGYRTDLARAHGYSLFYQSEELGGPIQHGKSGRKIWFGIGVETQHEMPIYEHSFELLDGSVKYIRVWEDAYEIDGVITNITDRPKFIKVTHEVLHFLMAHKGEIFTSESILQDPNLLRPGSTGTRRTRFHSAIGALTHDLGKFGYEISGKIGKTGKKWYGIGVSEEAVNRLRNELDLGSQDIANVPWPEGSLVDHILSDNPDEEATDEEGEVTPTSDDLTIVGHIGEVSVKEDNENPEEKVVEIADTTEAEEEIPISSQTHKPYPLPNIEISSRIDGALNGKGVQVVKREIVIDGEKIALSKTELKILEVIYKNGDQPSEIADLFILGGTGTPDILDKLYEQGIVMECPDQTYKISYAAHSALVKILGPIDGRTIGETYRARVIT